MFKMKRLTLSIILLSLLMQAGCQAYSIRNRSDDYLSAKTTPALKTPPGVSSIQQHSPFDIPDVANEGLAYADALMPPDLR